MDEQLLDRAKQGDQKAFGKIYSELHNLLFGVVIEALKPYTNDAVHEAGSVFEDTFMEVIKKVQWQGQKEFVSYFRRYLERRFQDKVRELKKRPKTVPPEELEGQYGDEEEAGRIPRGLRGEYIEKIGGKNRPDNGLEKEELKEMLERFREELKGALRRHLEAVIETFRGDEADIELIDVVSDVVDFLESKGRYYEETVRSTIMNRCGCNKRGAYDSHNKRLREKWKEFKIEYLREVMGRW